MATFFQLWSIVLYPPINGCMVHLNPLLAHHLLQIPVTKGISAIQAYAQQDDFGLKMMPFEKSGGSHK
jgi:hypothetical protein